jgi:hypothetical protein
MLLLDLVDTASQAGATFAIDKRSFFSAIFVSLLADLWPPRIPPASNLIADGQ